MTETEMTEPSARPNNLRAALQDKGLQVSASEVDRIEEEIAKLQERTHEPGAGTDKVDVGIDISVRAS